MDGLKVSGQRFLCINFWQLLDLRLLFAHSVVATERDSSSAEVVQLLIAVGLPPVGSTNTNPRGLIQKDVPSGCQTTNCKGIFFFFASIFRFPFFLD